MQNSLLLAAMLLAWLPPAHAADTSAQTNLYLARATAASGSTPIAGLLDEIRAGMPPLDNLSVLPMVRKVYPTGAKPLVVVSFKCPTEVIGIAPPTVKLLHGLVDYGTASLNKSNLLSFDIQQVCS